MTNIEMEGQQTLQKLQNEIARVPKTLSEEIFWRNMREQDEQELKEKETIVEELQKTLDQENVKE